MIARNLNCSLSKPIAQIRYCDLGIELDLPETKKRRGDQCTLAKRTSEDGHEEHAFNTPATAQPMMRMTSQLPNPQSNDFM